MVLLTAWLAWHYRLLGQKDDAERLSACCSTQVSTAPGALTVRALGDPGRVRQIIQNLLSNAASHGGTDIRISIQIDGATVSIRAGDNGNGVPPAQAEQIFEPYHRVHAASPTTASLGLGLSVSRTLARHMAGDLLYHRLDGITIFELQLPTAQPTEPSRGSQTDTASHRDGLDNRQAPAARPHGDESRSSPGQRREPARGTVI